MFNDEPFAPFEYNQKVYIFIDNKEIDSLPCTPIDDSPSSIMEIPDKTWIKYKGVIRYLGALYMRFEYLGEHVYLSPSLVKYLENIPQKDRHTKINTNIKNTISTVPKKPAVKFVSRKTNKSSVVRRKK